MTPYGIEPATFRFVAQQLNHCAAAVPITDIYDLLTWDIIMTLKERNILKTVKRKERATCVCHILRRNFLLKQVIERKTG